MKNKKLNWLFTLLLSFCLVLVPSDPAQAAESTDDYFDSVDSTVDNTEIQVSEVETIDTTLPNSYPGKLVIDSIKGSTFQETTSGKNLLYSYDLTKKTINGVTFTPVYENGLLQYIELNGTASDNAVYAIITQATAGFDRNSVLDKSLIISGKSTELAHSYVQVWNANGNSEFYLSNRVTKETQFTFTNTDSNFNVVLVVSNGITVTSERFYPMLRLASVTDGTYEPYTGGPTPNPTHPQELQSVVFNEIKITDDNGNLSSVTLFEPIELNGIGSVRDEIKNGQLIKRFEKIVFDGSDDEVWNVNIQTSTSQFYTNIIDGAMPNGLILNSNFMTNSSGTTSITNSSYISDTKRLNCFTPNYSSVKDFRSYLNRNPMTVLYELSEPVVTDLPIVDQLALQNLKTFEGTSYVSFDSDIKPSVKFRYSTFQVIEPHASLTAFVGFMGTIIGFVQTEFTIWGFTFSYWQIIVLSCLAGLIGWFIHDSLS